MCAAAATAAAGGAATAVIAKGSLLLLQYYRLYAVDLGLGESLFRNVKLFLPGDNS